MTLATELLKVSYCFACRSLLETNSDSWYMHFAQLSMGMSLSRPAFFLPCLGGCRRTLGSGIEFLSEEIFTYSSSGTL